MNPIIHLKIIGVLLGILAFAHLFFPTYFKWKTDLQALSLINRQMMYIHTFFIGLILVLMSLLCLTSANELVTTALGKKITIGLGIFWATRLFIQFGGYSSELWKGKKFETIVHIFFIFLWAYLTIIFFYVYYTNPN
ncbi:MAG TPA: hypothetical protein PKH93_05230 [Chitinophagales bacterium]|nr:hypothetical protein [Chitinophagales bacterium]